MKRKDLCFPVIGFLTTSSEGVYYAVSEKRGHLKLGEDALSSLVWVLSEVKKSSEVSLGHMSLSGQVSAQNHSCSYLLDLTASFNVKYLNFLLPQLHFI